MNEPLVVPDVVEEVEVSTISGCYMSGEENPYSQIDFTNIEHILDFSLCYSSPSKIASTSKNLLQQTHQSNKHTVRHPTNKYKEPERKFLCYLCGRRFSRSTNVRRHKLVHTGEKPYRCHICRKPFSRKDHLKSHLLCHEKEKQHCYVCGDNFFDIKKLTEHCRSHVDHEYIKASRTATITSNKISLIEEVQSFTIEAPVPASGLTQYTQSTLQHDHNYSGEVSISLISNPSINSSQPLFPPMSQSVGSGHLVASFNNPYSLSYPIQLVLSNQQVVLCYQSQC